MTRSIKDTPEEIINNGMGHAKKQKNEERYYEERNRLESCLQTFKEQDPARYEKYLPYCKMSYEDFIPLKGCS